MVGYGPRLFFLSKKIGKHDKKGFLNVRISMSPSFFESPLYLIRKGMGEGVFGPF